MEYIERDTVMQKFADHVKRSNNSDFAPAPTWNEAVQIVEDIDAADARPIVWGNWIWDDEGFHCSECLLHAYGNTGEILSGTYHYCPNCGSMMRRDDL